MGASFFSLLLLLFTLAACNTEPTPLPVPTPLPTYTPASTPTRPARPTSTPPATALQAGRFTVDLVYRRQAAFGSKALGSDEESRWAFYLSEVLKPADNFFDGYPDPAFTQANFAHEGAEVEPEEYIRLAELADSANIATTITNTLAAIDTALPGKPATIYVFTGLPTLADGVGSTGPGAGRVALIFGEDTVPVSANTTGLWHQFLPYHLYRELYLGARLDALGRPQKGDETLLDILIDYGLADTFAHSALPEDETPWLNPFTPEQEKSVWEQMQPLLASKERSDQDLFVSGNFSGTVPPWSAFIIGYRIANAYLAAHPGVSAVDLLSAPSATILEGSGFQP